MTVDTAADYTCAPDSREPCQPGQARRPHRRSRPARLSTRQFVTPLDVLVGIGLLPAAQVEAWRRGRVPYVERAACVNLAALSTALRLLGDWARRHDLTASETARICPVRTGDSSPPWMRWDW